MSFHVPYSSTPDGHGSQVYAAVLNIGLSSANRDNPRTRPLEAIIDSGASRCVFHADFATALGLELESGIAQRVQGIGGTEKIWLHPVTLHIPEGPVRVLAGFMKNLPVAGLLGMAGFFEHYTVTFDWTMKESVLQRVYRV